MQADASHVTLDDYLSYNPEQVEIADGQMIFSAARTGQPPRVITRLTRRLDRFVMRARLGLLLEGASFILDGDREAGLVRSARRCDLAFVAQGRLADQPARDTPLWLAPDLAIEVVESGQWPDEVDARAAEYLRFGARLAWVIDTLAPEVRVFSPQDPDGSTLAGADLLSADPVIPGWAVEVESIFGR